MKKFDQFLTEYQKTYREYENFNLKYIEDEEKGIVIDEEKNFTEYQKLQKNYTKAYEKFHNSFLQEIKNQNLSHEVEFSKILTKTINSKNWEHFYLIKDIAVPYNTYQSEQYIKIITWTISEILESSALSIEIENGKLEWSKGAMLEALINALNLKLNQDFISKAVGKILQVVDEDNIGNYHLLKKCISILSYINNKTARKYLKAKIQLSNDEEIITHIKKVLDKK
ncbi:hypothetical protein [Aureispira anguillae]|uniref:Uncharacterized protein n=1 Tax=Aureispira anguillae TaxID=2864201 RepID=A0A915YEH5_9BACT|nr:hypothetical protein [Aureispira anguillae]BDS11521.1 hypothetical protein AsAng_0022350 [Aureispira anguillae]